MKLFKEDGFPTSKGLEAIKPFENSIRKLLESNDVKNMSASQTRTLMGWLNKTMGDILAKDIADKITQ